MPLIINTIDCSLLYINAAYYLSAAVKSASSKDGRGPFGDLIAIYRELDAVEKPVREQSIRYLYDIFLYGNSYLERKKKSNN